MQAEVVINDQNWQQHVAETIVIDGEKKMRGLIPRDYSAHPVGYLECAKPFDLPHVPQEKYEDALALMKASKGLLSDVRNRGIVLPDGKGTKPIPSRDQNGKGYCWGHSGTSASILVRAFEHQPFADLSAYSVCATIKNYRDEGGFGAQGIKFIAERGIATSLTWPQKSMDRDLKNDPKVWEEAAKYKITEWMDFNPRDIKEQLITCLLMGIPVVVDYNWWSHSVCAIDIVSFKPFKIRIWNSWGDGWSANGTGILEGDKAIPDGAIAPRVMSAAA